MNPVDGNELLIAILHHVTFKTGKIICIAIGAICDPQATLLAESTKIDFFPPSKIMNA